MKDLRGEPHELFRVRPDSTSEDKITLALEVLLDPNIRDPYGQEKKLTTTRLRYEVVIQKRIENGSLERVYVVSETAKHISKRDDRLFKYYKKADHGQLSKFAFVGTRKTPFLSVSDDEGSSREILIHQDGTQGRIRHLPAGEAEATAISTIRTATEFPHLFALREELASLRYLQLEPSAERKPSDILAADRLEPDGSNLAAVLARIEKETSRPERPKGVIEDIRADLADLIPGIVDLDTERNEAAREYRLFLRTKEGLRLSSRVVSDGTLRILALLAVLHDPKRKGVICFEEPENGIHESRLIGLIRILRDSCTNLAGSPGGEDAEPLTQIIVNTHSPVVISCLLDNEIIVADTVTAISDRGLGNSRKTRMRTGVSPIGDLFEPNSNLTRFEIDRLLRRNKDFAA